MPVTDPYMKDGPVWAPRETRKLLFDIGQRTGIPKTKLLREAIQDLARKKGLKELI